MTKIFIQNVIGSRFDAQSLKDCSDTLVCSYGWASSKGQQEIEYSVDCFSIPKDKLDDMLKDMPYVTEKVTVAFHNEQVFDNNGKPTAEPCTLHDYNIGKFGELNLFFRVHGNGDGLFKVKFPIDAISTDDLKAFKAGSQWFVKIN